MKLSNHNQVSEAASLPVTQTWLWYTKQIKKCDNLCDGGSLAEVIEIVKEAL